MVLFFFTRSRIAEDIRIIGSNTMRSLVVLSVLFVLFDLSVVSIVSAAISRTARAAHFCSAKSLAFRHFFRSMQK